MRLRSFIPDWFLYLAVVVLLVMIANREREPVVLPPSTLPDLGPLLPSESPRDERILVKIDAPASGIGTAFASSGDGDWVTARHVVDSCDEVGVRIASRRLLRVNRSEIYKDADLAVLKTRWEREPLATDLERRRTIGEPGFFIGFPQGKPGEVVGTLLSRGRMQVRGRYQSQEGVLIWSEVGRTRGLTGSLGGLSGGPVLDADGELIGVVAAGNAPARPHLHRVAAQPAPGRRRDTGRGHTSGPKDLRRASRPVAAGSPRGAGRLRQPERVGVV